MILVYGILKWWIIFSIQFAFGMPECKDVVSFSLILYHLVCLLGEELYNIDVKVANLMKMIDNIKWISWIWFAYRDERKS